MDAIDEAQVEQTFLNVSSFFKKRSGVECQP